jgi:cell division protein FtsZ
VPAPAQTAVVVIIGVLAVLLLLRILVAVPGRVRQARRPEARAIRVVGVGGGGSNAVDRMVAARIEGVDFVACNTDAQALRRSAAGSKIRIGEAITRGLGSGGDPEIGRRAAEEDQERISRAVAGADLVFVTAGLGGGTGSGAAPIIAASARDHGALTIAVVTKPFAFEGSQRKRIADTAAAELTASVDALIVVPNDRIGDIVPEDTPMIEAFGVVDDVLLQAVQGIITLITAPGVINLDFADVRSVMKDAGPALIGLGVGTGENRATDAARQAINSPLLEASIDGARGILFNVAGPSDLRLGEVRRAADEIRGRADLDANVIFGASLSDSLDGDVLVTLIATGLNGHERTEAPAVEPEGMSSEVASTQIAEPKAAPKRPARAINARSAVDVTPSPAEIVDRELPPPSPPEEDDLEVPSFLRRRGRTAISESTDVRPSEPEIEN